MCAVNITFMHYLEHGVFRYNSLAYRLHDSGERPGLRGVGPGVDAVSKATNTYDDNIQFTLLAIAGCPV